MPKNDGFDYYKYITTASDTLDTVLDASPEQMLRAMNPTGERFDIDKEHEEMNEECMYSREITSKYFVY